MNDSQKLDILLSRITTIEENMVTKAELAEVKENMVTKAELAEVKENMVTKNYLDIRLHELQNDILVELDTVQEKSNAQYHELKDEIRLIRDGFHTKEVQVINTRLSIVEKEVIEIKKKVS